MLQVEEKLNVWILSMDTIFPSKIGYFLTKTFLKNINHEKYSEIPVSSNLIICWPPRRIRRKLNGKLIMFASKIIRSLNFCQKKFLLYASVKILVGFRTYLLNQKVSVSRKSTLNVSAINAKQTRGR